MRGSRRFLCSITTGIGLASLHTSQIIPIAKFGDFSAIGVFAMLIILFLFLPATLKLWPWTPPEMRGRKAAAGDGRGQGARVCRRPSGRVLGAVRHVGRRHNMAVMLACFAVIGVLCLGLPRVQHVDRPAEAVQQRRAAAGGLSLV